MVLRVDKEKGYIDLSKRRVAPEDLTACEDKYNKSKMVHSIMRHVAETTGSDVTVRRAVAAAAAAALMLLPPQELYEQLGWPLYKRYGHAFEAFKTMGQDPDAVLAELAASGAPPPSDAVTSALLVNIRRRMTPQPLKIRADVELTCFGYDGVLHIKDAMRAAQALSRPDCAVQMKLVAPPLYVLTTQTLEKEVGITLLEEATAAAAASIDKAKGRLVVKEAARAVSERDEKLLAEKLDKLAAANEEVAGDSEDDADETSAPPDSAAACSPRAVPGH
jgi:translation initiation factor 2 subunit 1